MSRQRRPSVRERVRQTFEPEDGGGPPPPSDAVGVVLEALVAFVLGTGFWRLVVSDSWVSSAVFGVLLAGLLFAYGLVRRRAVERSRRPPRA